MPEHSVTLKSTPFDAAIDHFERKLRIPTRGYYDLPGEVHAKSFMIAGAVNDAMLADFQSAILQGLKDGTTLQRFRDDFDRIVATHGWQYNGKSGWRSAVIFRTNMRTSLMAGKWERAQAVKDIMPYLRYVQVQRPTKRPDHSRWHGMVVRIDDPWWHTHYPPNGWGCLCTAQSVSDALLAQEGWKVTENPVSEPGDVPEEWAYNVGKAGRVATGPERAQWEPVITTRDYATYKRPQDVPLDTPKAKLGPPAANQQDTYKAVRQMLGGAGGAITGPDGVTVGITAKNLGAHLRLDRAPVLPFLPETIADPYEIWLMPYRDALTGRVELRRRYIKGLALDKKLFTWFIGEYRQGELQDVTLIRTSRVHEIQKQRAGILVYGRKMSK